MISLLVSCNAIMIITCFVF